MPRKKDLGMLKKSLKQKDKMSLPGKDILPQHKEHYLGRIVWKIVVLCTSVPTHSRLGKSKP